MARNALKKGKHIVNQFVLINLSYKHGYVI